jgi:hypothetical protein
MTNPLTALETARWDSALDPAAAADVTRELEAGKVIFLPRLRFALLEDEQRFLAQDWLEGGAKNISFDPATGKLAHTSAGRADRAQLTAMAARFAGQARALVSGLFPHYRPHLRQGLASFRPVETHGRTTSRRKDDTLLHVDAFASRPNQGSRILRVFCNINPRGAPRVWEIGEPFDAVAQQFLGRVPPPWPGSAWLLEKLRITKGRRSEYDHVMLNLHDRAKLDDGYQRATPRTRVEFPAHSTWVVFTDRVMHAALDGQFLLEQTFYLPVAAMQDARCSPLYILEQHYQRQLA